MLKLLLSLFMVAGLCSADLVTLSLDFTQKTPWAGADGKTSFTYDYGAISIALEAGTLEAGNRTTTLRQNESGIGIVTKKIHGKDALGSGEIDGKEVLTIGFRPTVGLDSATVGKLFFSLGDQDAGLYQINGMGPWMEFWGVWGDRDGTVALNIGRSDVNSIAFKPLHVGLFSRSDYTLKGMEVSVQKASVPKAPVPEGGLTLTLLGGALAVLEALRRQLRG